MSGKSTLLRTVGISVVLALLGAPVRAHSLRLSVFVPGATLRVQDSLQTGISRFYAEILRLRQLLDMAQQQSLLFLVDEILAGTNSAERRQGAAAILQALLDRGAVGLTTTHDLALTELATKWSERACNVHFADTWKDGHISFDYQLRPGVVSHGNALALMRAVGLDV
jgi:DNA mismatch repair ATPase MutS